MKEKFYDYWTLSDRFRFGSDGNGRHTVLDKTSDVIEVDCEVIKDERVK